MSWICPLCSLSHYLSRIITLCPTVQCPVRQFALWLRRRWFLEAPLAPTPVCPLYIRIFILSASLRPQKASRRHCGGRHRGGQDGWHAGQHGGRTKKADMKLDMVADMEVDSLADKAANMELDMVADMEVDIDKMADNKKMSWLIGPKLFHLKLTRIAYLLSFASFVVIYWFQVRFSNQNLLHRQLYWQDTRPAGGTSATCSDFRPKSLSLWRKMQTSEATSQSPKVRPLIWHLTVQGSKPPLYFLLLSAILHCALSKKSLNWVFAATVAFTVVATVRFAKPRHSSWNLELPPGCFVRRAFSERGSVVEEKQSIVEELAEYTMPRAGLEFHLK